MLETLCYIYTSSNSPIFFYLLSTFQLSLFFINYPLQLKKYTFLSEISCLTFLFDLLLEGQRPKAKQDPI